MSIRDLLIDLMSVPGLSGHDDRVRRRIAEHLGALPTETDRLGNLWTTFEGSGPSVFLFTHMDQLGFIVRKIEADGFLRLERLGGVPERALASQEVIVCVGAGRDVPGLIANKRPHAMTADE